MAVSSSGLMSLMISSSFMRSPVLSKLNSRLGLYSLGEGVLDFAHLCHKIGILHQCLWCIAPGDNEMYIIGLVGFEPINHLHSIQPAKMHGVGEFIQDDQIVVPTDDLLLGDLPAVEGAGNGFLHILRGPSKAITGRKPVDLKLL